MAGRNGCEQAELACALALQALGDEERTRVAAHVRLCAACRDEVALLRRLFDSFAFWPTDVLRPSPSLRSRLAHRLQRKTGRPKVQPPPSWRGPEWKEVAPGIACKLLSLDVERRVVGMLVRLAPRAEYPPHTHAGIEELHLLDGELWIDERKLHPGEYNRAVPGTADKHVWSETGCTCVLITSTSDVLADKSSTKGQPCVRR